MHKLKCGHLAQVGHNEIREHSCLSNCSTWRPSGRVDKTPPFVCYTCFGREFRGINLKSLRRVSRKVRKELIAGTPEYWNLSNLTLWPIVRDHRKFDASIPGFDKKFKAALERRLENSKGILVAPVGQVRSLEDDLCSFMPRSLKVEQKEEERKLRASDEMEGVEGLDDIIGVVAHGLRKFAIQKI
jgi:hypothetical protein